MVVREEMLSWTIELRLGAWGIVTILSWKRQKRRVSPLELAWQKVKLQYLCSAKELFYDMAVRHTWLAYTSMELILSIRDLLSVRTRQDCKARIFGWKILLILPVTQGDLPEHTSEPLISQLSTPCFWYSTVVFP